jgi:chlorobactene glucosyltransferase
VNAGTAAAAAAWGASTFANVLQLLGACYNARTAPRLEDHEAAGRAGPYPRVSLLIPARDEEANLEALMPMLARLEWPDLEILILDDESRDATARIAGSGRARVLAGRPLPPGWLGKNWACRQLAGQATGDILLFCDADVRPAPGAIAATVGCLRAYGADAVTGLPRQLMGTWSEKAVLPVLLGLPLLGFLPLAQVPRLKSPAVSIGCGQWFAFTRSAYARLGGHAAVRREVVEDLALGRRVKEKGLVLAAALSHRLVATRMYAGFPSLWRGFSKNLIALTGTGFARPPLVLGAFVLANLAPWILPWSGARAWFLPLALWLAARWIAARINREPASAWLWSPVGAAVIPALAAHSWWLHRRRAAVWKGRVLTAAFGNTEGAEGAEGREPETAAATAGKGGTA